MESVTLHEAKNLLDELISKSVADQKPLKITSDDGNAILISEEMFQNVLVTLELLSTPGLFDSIKEDALNT